MPSSHAAGQLHATLRGLAATDPRQARAFINQLLDGNDPGLDSLLRAISIPGEGRARQIVANAVQTRKDKTRLIPFLLKWRDVEVDEFTREAIAGALTGVDTASHTQPTLQQMPDMVDTYRYVSERLCHRIRNAIAAPAARIRRLQSLAEDIPDPDARAQIASEVAQILDSFRRVSRLVEFDIGDSYFQHRSVVVRDWIAGLNTRYSAVNEPVTLVLDVLPAEANHRIYANDQQLETIFWNLWSNSVQAVHAGGRDRVACQITVRMRTIAGGTLGVTVFDNGPGIPAEHADTLFSVGFSTKGEGRGRGLLEVQDAVRRLFGTVNLVEEQPGEFRVCMSFPLETT